MANIKAFSFYLSYHEALKDLPIEDRKLMLLAIDDFVFEDKKPQLKGVNKIIWTLIEPNLTTSKNRSNKNSGAPLGNANACKTKENNEENKNNQNLIKKQSKNNQSSQDIFNDISYSYIIYQLSLINIINNNNKDNIINSIKEYIQLRHDNGWSIKESTIVRLVNKLNDYGKTDKEKLGIIGKAIDNGWKDFYPPDKKDKEVVTQYETV